MNLYEYFIDKLEESGLSKSDIRFIGAQDLLRKRVSNSALNAFSKKVGINRGTLSHMLSGKRAVPLSLLSSFDMSTYRIAIKNSNVAITIPLILSKELAYLVGVLRDGTIAKEKSGEYCCSFYNMNLDLLSAVKRFLERTFNLPTKIRHFGDCYGIRIRSITLYLFFRLIFEVPNKQENWNTPAVIKQSGNEIKKWYVSGFFDAEGGVPHIEENILKRKKHLYVKFVQKNKESLEFIKYFLEMNGIKMRSVYWERNKYVLKVSNKSIPRFVDFIFTFHPEKSKRLAELRRIFS